MAQDFYRLFHLGEGRTTISLVDGQGVALAAVKGLYGIARVQQAALHRQADQFASLRTTVRSQRSRLGAQGRQIATLQREVRALLKANKH